MEAFLGCKYLTNSRLFRLQLHDPLIRTQVLTQLLIVLNYASAATALAVASPPASSSPAPNPSPPKKGANDLVKHARRLIRNTSAQGAVYLGVLDTVLHREQAWLSWKRLQRCEPRIEKPPAPPARTVRTMEAVRQALAGAGKPSGVVAQQQKAFYGRPLPVPRPVNLAEVEAEVGEAVGRTFENYVRPRMEEAEDPEACIDEEYHPRHEPVFCWRAMRLGWAADARVLVGMENASLDALCRKMKGEDGEEDGGGEGKGKEEGRRKRKRKENGEAGAEQEVMHGT
ncbi:THO complex, subunit THOC1 [Nannochloropsis gaditana]|uniref:THO complex, subunit THOC1 n=2 Tax=Nannochloropsis gaditana TaxID=72520 RepID=W7U467_9STRA|nr:THO complex, subunit THOC1 [Nannochloropsis gaditana]